MAGARPTSLRETPGLKNGDFPFPLSRPLVVFANELWRAVSYLANAGQVHSQRRKTQPPAHSKGRRVRSFYLAAMD